MVRRRRNNSVSVLTAVLVELGTILAIIALAQPTWTRGGVVGGSAPAEPQQALPGQPLAAEQAAPAVPLAGRAAGAVLGLDVPRWDRPAGVGGWQAVRPMGRNNPDRIASVPDLSVAKSRSEMTPLAPIYPPSSTDSPLPPWGTRY